MLSVRMEINPSEIELEDDEEKPATREMREHSEDSQPRQAGESKFAIVQLYTS